jgi:hypothetical protein
MQPIGQTELQRSWPLTLAYFEQFEAELEIRSVHLWWGRGNPFYSMYNIGPYTFAPWKVVLKRTTRDFEAAVVSELPVAAVVRSTRLPTCVAVACWRNSDGPPPVPLRHSSMALIYRRGALPSESLNGRSASCTCLRRAAHHRRWESSGRPRRRFRRGADGGLGSSLRGVPGRARARRGGRSRGCRRRRALCAFGSSGCQRGRARGDGRRRHPPASESSTFPSARRTSSTRTLIGSPTRKVRPPRLPLSAVPSGLISK